MRYLYNNNCIYTNRFTAFNIKLFNTVQLIGQWNVKQHLPILYNALEYQRRNEILTYNVLINNIRKMFLYKPKGWYTIYTN